jgi:hypothetical protein
MQNWCFGTECTVSGYRSCEAFVLLHWTIMMFGSVSKHFTNLWQVKRYKSCIWGLNALFRGTEVVKHPFYSIGPIMIFGSVSEYFTNLWHVKRCKTCVWGLNTLFRGTEVVKHSFYSIGPKLMFGSVSGHFSNLQQVKDVKLASDPQCTIQGI